MFIDSLLRDKQLPDCQIEQASNAVGLYLDHFLSGDASSLSPEVQTDANICLTHKGASPILARIKSEPLPDGLISGDGLQVVR